MKLLLTATICILAVHDMGHYSPQKPAPAAKSTPPAGGGLTRAQVEQISREVFKQEWKKKFGGVMTLPGVGK